MRYSLRSFIGVIASAALAVAAIAAYYRNFPSNGANVPASMANRAMWSQFRLPDEATDVTYHADSYGCEAEFAIPETEFLAWCKKNNWPVEPLAAPEPYFQPVALADIPRSVDDGYRFELEDGRGIFDRKAGRAAFVVSQFP
ncbi:hypothetical protein [Aeoliella sp. SH292]|uniref:hypothetical protein n=1 Tax=Aeoliella sp. SH292 TaxID=3454464 RepID=UPI003F97516A